MEKRHSMRGNVTAGWLCGGLSQTRVTAMPVCHKTTLLRVLDFVVS